MYKREICIRMLCQQQAGARKNPIISWTVTFGLAPLKQVWKHAVRKQTHSHSLIPPQLARKPTSKTTFHNVHINDAYLTLWLCLSLLGLDFVLLSGYPTPFLGCVCAVSLPQTRERETARERVKVEGGSDICIPKVACDADSANGNAACALASLPLLPKSLLSLHQHHGNTKGFNSSLGFHGASLETQKWDI